jgi:hypothetical protein
VIVTKELIFSFFRKHWPVLVIIFLIFVSGVLWWRMDKIRENYEQQESALQNRIAELSSVVRENDSTWSRLAKVQTTESVRIIDELRARNSELSSLVESRNENILQLTTVVGRLRNVAIRPTQNEITQTIEPQTTTSQERIRVAFDSTHMDFMRVRGFSLTNPAEVSLDVEFVRPINFTVVTTQSEDRSWRTYIQSDVEGLEIGEIQSTVNPRLIAPNAHRIEQDITVGLSAIVGVRGDSGAASLDVGYDFGALEISLAGGVIFSGSADFAVGGRVEVSPFDI